MKACYKTIKNISPAFGSYMALPYVIALRKTKNISPQRHGDAEKSFFIINCAYDAVNKAKLCVSVPLR